jgi:hypothetical protein
MREAEIYRTGMGMLLILFCQIPSYLPPTHTIHFFYRTEVIDLTHPENVELFRKWDTQEVAFIQLLRFIRICSTDPELALVSRPGKHFTLVGGGIDANAADADVAMDTEDK